MGSLTPLARLILERILLADKVAAAKFDTDRPIDDPARERQELSRVAELSVGMGLDPEVSTAFFRDQIEANKVVQRGLHALWTDHPELRPSVRPDLTGEVRPRLDELTMQILDGLRAVAGGREQTSGRRSGAASGPAGTPGRTGGRAARDGVASACDGVAGGRESSGPGSGSRVGERAGAGNGPAEQPPLVPSGQRLDTLHRESLNIALRSICDRYPSVRSRCAQPGA